MSARYRSKAQHAPDNFKSLANITETAAGETLVMIFKFQTKLPVVVPSIKIAESAFCFFGKGVDQLRHKRALAFYIPRSLQVPSLGC